MPSPHTLIAFAKTVLALFIVLDPLGILPILVGLRSRMDPGEARHVAYKVVGGGTILLLFFTATGTWVLRFFGVTIDDLRIGGGLLLLIISLRMVIEGRIGPGQEQDYRAAVVPLISPLLVGPGAITASVVFAGMHGIALTSLAVLTAMLLCLGVFMTTNFIHRLLGDSGTDLVTRIMGILVATIAVSYMRAGFIGVIRASGGG